MRGMRGVSLNFSLNAGMFVAMEKYLFKYKNSQALNLFCMMMVVVTFIFLFLFMYISRANDFTFYVKNQHSIRTMIKLILVTFYTFISLHMTKHFLHILIGAESVPSYLYIWQNTFRTYLIGAESVPFKIYERVQSIK